MRMKKWVWCDVFSMQSARGPSRGRRALGEAPWAPSGPRRRRRKSVVGGRPLRTTLRRW